MSNCKVMQVDSRYNQQMLEIVKSSPIKANGLELYFDKSPDIFEIPRMKYNMCEHLGFFKDDLMQGFGSLGFYNALVNLNEEKIFTFYNFYLLPQARGKQIPHLAMKEFFSKVKGKANYGISLTLKGNRAAESYIGKTIDDWMPQTRVIDELVVKSMLFTIPKRNESKYSVRNARYADIPAIIQLLKEEHQQRDFGLIFNEENFLDTLEDRGLEIENYFVACTREGAIRGVCLAWDCSSFRRTRVNSFSSRFYPSLLAYKLVSKFFPLAPFPKPGESFKELTITDYAVAERDPAIMYALLTEVYRSNYNRHYHFMNWASCGSDSLLVAAKGFRHMNLVSHIIFTSMDPARYQLKTRLPYVDLAFI